jgi:hypothetical protein
VGAAHPSGVLKASCAAIMQAKLDQQTAGGQSSFHHKGLLSGSTKIYSI